MLWGEDKNELERGAMVHIGTLALSLATGAGVGAGGGRVWTQHTW